MMIIFKSLVIQRLHVINVELLIRLVRSVTKFTKQVTLMTDLSYKGVIELLKKFVL